MRPSKAIGFWNEAITLEGLADSIDRNSIRFEMPSSPVVSDGNAVVRRRVGRTGTRVD